MARVGFIHDKLDIKFLILYIMSRVAAPIDMPTLADLTMCDEGVDYFDFAEAAAELVSTCLLYTSKSRGYELCRERHVCPRGHTCGV